MDLDTSTSRLQGSLFFFRQKCTFRRKHVHIWWFLVWEASGRHVRGVMEASGSKTIKNLRFSLIFEGGTGRRWQKPGVFIGFVKPRCKNHCFFYIKWRGAPAGGSQRPPPISLSRPWEPLQLKAVWGIYIPRFRPKPFIYLRKVGSSLVVYW